MVFWLYGVAFTRLKSTKLQGTDEFGTEDRSKALDGQFAGASGRAGYEGAIGMSKLRVLVGTRKGAFVLSSDASRKQWKVEGPQFAGWEIYHLKGSPADPDRLYASQSSGWFGQVMQRSNDVGKTWETAGNQFPYEGAGGPRTWNAFPAHPHHSNPALPPTTPLHHPAHVAPHV